MAYTDEEKEQIGQAIAEMLCMKKSKTEKGRYQTTWGTKTGIGIFETIKRLSAEMESGNIINVLK